MVICYLDDFKELISEDGIYSMYADQIVSYFHEWELRRCIIAESPNTIYIAYPKDQSVSLNDFLLSQLRREYVNFTEDFDVFLLDTDMIDFIQSYHEGDGSTLEDTITEAKDAVDAYYADDADGEAGGVCGCGCCDSE